MPFRRTRRYRTSSRYGQQRSAPPPPPATDPLPTLRKEVAAIYKNYGKLVVADASTRANHLIKAFEPLDKIVRIAVVRHLTPADSNRLWEIVAKCRARALGTPFEHEKETAIRIALSKVDRIVCNMQVPRFEEAQSVLDANVAVFAVKAAKRATREAKAAEREAKRAARAARTGIPVVPRPVVPRPTIPRPVAPPPPFVGATINWDEYDFVADPNTIRSPYQAGSCRGIMFDMLVRGWNSKADCVAAAAGTAKDPGAVFHTNFYPYRNKRDSNERYFQWQVAVNADRPGTFRIMVRK